MPDLLFHFDKSGTFLSFYQESDQLYKQPDEFVGKNIFNVFEKEFADRIQNAINETIKKKYYKLFYELQLTELKYFHAKFAKLNQNEVISIVRDITEIKNAEKQLQEYTSELSRLNADKDRFMQILAHDLRSPFNSILGLLYLLIDNIHKYDKEEIERDLILINQTSFNTYNLLEDLLLWIKSQSGKLKFKPQKIFFYEICNELITNFKTNSKKIVINYFVPEEIVLNADLNMLKTILRNLTSNAIKFTNDNGRIDISAEKKDKYAIIKVSDNGIGIAEENQSKFWDITNQYSTVGTDGEKGSSLGLVLCKEFVEKHGGKIWFESKLGKGTDFKFTMPLYNQ